MKVIHLTGTAAQFLSPQWSRPLGQILKYTSKLWTCLLFSVECDAEGGSNEMFSCKGEKRFVLAERNATLKPDRVVDSVSVRSE